MYGVDKLGLNLTGARKAALLAEARQKYGPCVKELSMEQLNANSQLSYIRNGVTGKH